ncbi:MAG: ROK family protein [Halobacteriaceae archaeon]
MYGAIDLGATNLRAAVGESDINTVIRLETPRTRLDIENAIEDVLVEACDVEGANPSQLLAVGIGSIGPLKREAGIVLDPPNLPVAKIELSAPISRVADCEPVIQNDAIAGLRAELSKGAPDNSVYLTMSTGIGAGASVDGSIVQGASGNAAEVGHFIVEPDGRSCGCGGEGHWEAYCGGANIPSLARDLASTVPATGLDLDSNLTARDIFSVQDPLSRRVREEIIKYSARGLANIAHAYDPTVMMIGGSVATNNADRFIPSLRERVPNLLAIQPPKMRLTTLDDPVLVGAFVAARESN